MTKEIKLGQIKRGASFAFKATIRDRATKEPVTGIAGRLRCQMRYQATGPLVAELTITESSTPGTYNFAAASTNNWCFGKILKTDIKYTDANGKVSSSTTLTVEVVEDYTHGN